MATRKNSIYNTDPKLFGDETITLSGEERTWIVEALARVAPSEVDAIPLIELMNKIVSGK